MKKYFYLCFMVLFVFLVSGCGGKKLKCSRENNYNNQLDMKQKLNITFKNDTVSKLSMEMDASMSEDYMTFRDSLIESAESEYMNIDSKAVSFSSKKSDNGFVFNVSINYNKLSDDEKKELYIVDYEKNYDSIKSDLEEAGYSCN